MPSKLFGTKRPDHVRHQQSRGQKGEIGDLRDDVEEAFADLEAGGRFQCDEFTNPPAANSAYWVAARATATSEQTLTSGAGLANTTVSGARLIVVTRSNAASAYTTDPIIVKGKSYGKKVTIELVPLNANGNDFITSEIGFEEITEIVLPAQATTGGQFMVGFGAQLALRFPVKVRAGLPQVLRENEAGTIVTTGTFSARSYLPAVVPNAVRDYAVTYEVG